MSRSDELRRKQVNLHAKRWRDRQAGRLPPVQRCVGCDGRCLNDRWLGFCYRCAQRIGCERLPPELYKYKALQIIATKQEEHA